MNSMAADIYGGAFCHDATAVPGYGVKVYNSPDNYDAFHNMQLAQFDGKKWVGMGEMISLEDLTIT